MARTAQTAKTRTAAARAEPQAAHKPEQAQRKDKSEDQGETKSGDQGEIDAFFASLIPAKVGLGGYTPVQRQRDFRAVLVTGDAAPAQCRRVLWQLFDQCGLYRSALAAGRPDVTGHRIGKQDVARWLLAILNGTPRERPTRAESDDPDLA